MALDLLHLGVNARDYLLVGAIFLIAGGVSWAIRLPLLKSTSRLFPAGVLPWALAAIFAAIELVLPLDWPDVQLQVFSLSLLVMLSWRAASVDIDLGADGAGLWSERVVLGITAVLAVFSPLFVLPNLWLQCNRFDGLHHHSTLPLRLVVISSAYVLVWNLGALAGWTVELAPFLIVMLACHALGYVVAARAKARLGPRWYSWVLDNRLSDLMASAYSWGWGRFVTEKIWLRAVKFLARWNVPLQWPSCSRPPFCYRAAAICWPCC